MGLMGQYEYVIQKDHHRANEDGQVYVHVLAAEAMLGRLLLQDEVVHHRDKNKLNNRHDNLIVFATKSDHTRFHCYGCDETMLVPQVNGSYRTAKQEEEKICPCCGELFLANKKRRIYCNSVCARTHANTTRKPLKNVLYEDLIRNNGNFSTVASMYGVAGNTVRRWCKGYGIGTRSYLYRQEG